MRPVKGDLAELLRTMGDAQGEALIAARRRGRRLLLLLLSALALGAGAFFLLKGEPPEKAPVWIGRE